LDHPYRLRSWFPGIKISNSCSVLFIIKRLSLIPSGKFNPAIMVRISMTTTFFEYFRRFKQFACMPVIRFLHKNLFWIWIVLIFMANVIPFSLTGFTEEKPEMLSRVLKGGYLLHALTMFTLPWIYAALLKNGMIPFKSSPLFKLALIILAISFGAEFLQLLIPIRTFNLWDVFFNLLGGFLGLFIFSRTIRGVQ
jgi:VanZ family protein